jgi:hypothetical protein
MYPINILNRHNTHNKLRNSFYFLNLLTKNVFQCKNYNEKFLLRKSYHLKEELEENLKMLLQDQLVMVRSSFPCVIFLKLVLVKQR